jgi:hypothetical protein
MSEAWVRRHLGYRCRGKTMKRFGRCLPDGRGEARFDWRDARRLHEYCYADTRAIVISLVEIGAIDASDLDRCAL